MSILFLCFSALVSIAVKTFITAHLQNFWKVLLLVEHGAALMNFTGNVWTLHCDMCKHSITRIQIYRILKYLHRSQLKSRTLFLGLISKCSRWLLIRYKPYNGRYRYSIKNTLPWGKIVIFQSIFLISGQTFFVEFRRFGHQNQCRMRCVRHNRIVARGIKKHSW